MLSMEATIADLFNAEADLRHIADALRDAATKRRLDLIQLAELLAPHAARHALPRGDGDALLRRLMELAGLDVQSLARALARSSTHGTLSEVAKMVENVG